MGALRTGPMVMAAMLDGEGRLDKGKPISQRNRARGLRGHTTLDSVAKLRGACRMAGLKVRPTPHCGPISSEATQEPALFIKDSQEQEGGCFEEETLQIASSPGLRLSFGFYTRCVFQLFHRAEVPIARLAPVGPPLILNVKRHRSNSPQLFRFLQEE